MPVSLRLAIRQWHARPLRPVLCALAIAMAVALVVCVGAGFDSLRQSLETGISQMLGVAEIQVRPAQRGVNARLDARILDTARATPEVEEASARVQALVALTNPQEHRWFEAVGVDTTRDERLRPKVYLQGRALSGKPDEIVLDHVVAEALHATLGQTFKLSGDAGEAGGDHNVQVVGIVAHPQLEILQKPTVYLPAAPLMQVAGIAPRAPRYNVIDLKLRRDVDFQVFSQQLGKQLGPVAAVTSITTRKAKLDQDTRGLDLVIIVISVITGTCAALIIGTTLSVGIQERIRQFGQLRSIGASRGQLVIFLAADALLMMVVGTLAGFLLGWGLSHLMVLKYPQFFPVYRLGLQSIIVAAAEGLLATLLGSLIPIWQVIRVTPMEAVRASGQGVRARHVWLAGVIGAAALGLQVLLWLAISEATTRFWVYALAGVPLVFVGYCLLGPTVLLATERMGAAVLGRLFRVQPALLRHAWSRTPWRAGGMIAALMVGVTLFAVVRMRGEILLDSFDRRQAHFPDLFCFSFYPVANAKIDKLIQDIPEASVASRITILPVELGKPIFRLGAVTPENKTSFVCIEPVNFRKMVDLEFIQGDPDTAYALLSKGNHLLVSREFFVACGIGVGGVISLKTLGDKVTDFTVAAVVASNGLDMAKNYFDARSAFQDASVSSVVGSFADGQKYFDVQGANAVIMNARPGQDAAAALQRLRPKLFSLGMSAASSVEMKQGLRSTLHRATDAISLIAVAALIVASLGVANMVIASVHARRFEFGVLRAIGAGRGQLLGLVMAEITLVGLTAGALGAAAGTHMAFMTTRTDRVLVGMESSLAADGRMALIALGSLGITLAVAWAAAVVPAWNGARAAQRTLLAVGRT